MASTKYDKMTAEQTFLEAEQAEEKGDFRKAFELLSSGAKSGHAGSQLNLGNFYAWGRGVRRDLKKAAYWYKKAYRNGYDTGAFNLAIDRRNQGDVRSAVIWFKKAVAMNSGEACVELAKIYKARKDRRTAVGLLKRAVRLNRDHISDAVKEEAESLLKQMEKRY